jgi:hypothetical protein
MLTTPMLHARPATVDAIGSGAASVKPAGVLLKPPPIRAFRFGQLAPTAVADAAAAGQGYRDLALSCGEDEREKPG